MPEKAETSLLIEYDCERTELKKFRPTDKIVNSIEHLFTETLLARIADLKRELKPYLIESGFSVLQYPYSSRSAIVVEHPSIGHFVLKFSRDPHAAALGKFKGRLQMVKRRSLAHRAINANRLGNFIQENAFKHVRVPRKFFYCIANRFPILLAEKLSLHTHRTLADLTPEEVGEILALVEYSHGTLDLWPRNILVLDREIQFIDLERPEEPLRWQSIIFDSVKEFKERVNAECRPLVDNWFARVSRQITIIEPDFRSDHKLRKALKVAVVGEDPEKVRSLLKENVFEGRRLDKLLFKSIESGNVRIVEMLVENGANPNVPNKRGFTSFDFARIQNNAHILALLTKAMSHN